MKSKSRGQNEFIPIVRGQRIAQVSVGEAGGQGAARGNARAEGGGCADAEAGGISQAPVKGDAMLQTNAPGKSQVDFLFHQTL